MGAYQQTAYYDPNGKALMPDPYWDQRPQSFQDQVDPWAAYADPTQGAGTVDQWSDPAAAAPMVADPTVPEVAPTVAAPAAAQPEDPWAGIADTYGLGAPPAEGLPTSLPGVQIGAAPQANAAQLDLSQIPQPAAQQMPVDPRIDAMASGQGYSPDVLAKMKANAMESASNAGVQQIGQTKRILGQNGIHGGAAAAAVGDVARQTGQAQQTATNNIDIKNADVGNGNAQFGLGLKTNIGQNNMQAANSMALSNANAMFAGLKSNQDSTNTTNQMNTGFNFQRQNDQANLDFNTQKSQWDELNKRYGQAQNILGSWGSQS